MRLLTKAIERNLPALYATEDVQLDEKTVHVKYFDPTGAATWWIFEGTRQEDGNWLLFGMADLGMGCCELGYISLDELKSVKGRLGLGIERDRHFGTPIWGEVKRD